MLAHAVSCIFQIIPEVLQTEVVLVRVFVVSTNPAKQGRCSVSLRNAGLLWPLRPQWHGSQLKPPQIRVPCRDKSLISAFLVQKSTESAKQTASVVNPLQFRCSGPSFLRPPTQVRTGIELQVCWV